MPTARAIALFLGLLSATLAHATAQRTFVASTGTDANTAFNCSIAKPCRGFAAAIGVTSARGEVIVLDSAGYGTIPSITQSVTINAPAGVYAGISVLSGDGVTINAGINDTVVLRGLTINGQGGANGITINNALTVHVESCLIANLNGIGINQLKGTLELKDTIIRNNGNIGVYVVGPGQANLDHVRLEANDTGLAAEFGGQAAMQDSIVTGSPNIGVVANTPTIVAPSQVTISRSLVSSNNFGIYVDGNNGGCCNAIAAISDSTISGNGVGVHVTSSGNDATGTVHLKHNTVTANGVGVEVVSNGVAFADDNYMAADTNHDLDFSGGAFWTRGNNTVGSSNGSNIIHYSGM
jgi:hypothetical protein